MDKKIVIYSFKNYIIFKAPPTGPGQPKNYAMEKGGYLGKNVLKMDYAIFESSPTSNTATAHFCSD